MDQRTEEQVLKYFQMLMKAPASKWIFIKQSRFNRYDRWEVLKHLKPM